MKKRYIAGLALALMGILSGCGQAKTQPADNTISITPVEQATTEKQSGAVVEYHFSGNNTEANGITFNSYTWDGNAWQNMDKPIGVYGMGLNNGTGKIIFRHDADTINAAYDIEMTFPRGGASTQYGDSSELSKLPTDNLTVAGEANRRFSSRCRDTACCACVQHGWSNAHGRYQCVYRTR